MIASRERGAIRTPTSALLVAQWPALLAAVAGAMPFIFTVTYALVLDDLPLLRLVNEAYAAGGLREVLTSDFRPVGTVSFGLYRPAVLLSLLADARLWAGVPSGFHLTNVLLHGLNCALVFKLLEQVLGARRPALIGALLFAVHPVHTESVAFVSGRTDLLAASFILWASLLWLRTRRAPHAFGRAGAIGFFFAILLAELSKELALMLPAALLAWDALGVKGEAKVPWVRRNLAWLALWGAATACAIALRAGAGVGFGSPGGLTRAGARLAGDPGLAAEIWATYARLLVLPWPLNAFYGREHVTVTWVGALGALACVVLFVALIARRHRRAGALGAAWTVVFLLPVAQWVALDSAVVAERFLYVPSIGFCLAAGYALSLGGGLASRRLLIGGGCAALVALVFAVDVRNRVFRDEVTLYSSLAETSPLDPTRFDDLGQAYFERARYPEALQAYQRALAIDPKHSGALNSLGVLYSRLGRLEDAASTLRAAIAAKPDFPQPRFNLAALCLRSGDVECAREQQAALARLSPGAAAELDRRIRAAVPP